MKYTPVFTRCDNWMGQPSSVAAFKKNGAPVDYEDASRDGGAYTFYAHTRADAYGVDEYHRRPVHWSIDWEVNGRFGYVVAHGYSYTLDDAEAACRALFDAVRRYQTADAPAYFCDYDQR